MPKYVFDRHQLVADFVRRTKIASGFAPAWANFPDGNFKTIGIIDDDDELIAGIVYFNWHPQAGTIEISIEALPKQRWLTRTTLALMFQYPFLQCGCQMVMTKTSARSTHVLRMLEAMNFDNILIPRASGRHEDGYLCCLSYEDWVASKFCRRFNHHLIGQEEAA